MSKQANPTFIGVFTLLGLLIAGVGIVLFGAGTLFKRTYEVLLYFEKSAYGLQVGSDVRFGGVRIGRVQSISVLVDRENNRKIIPVVVELGEKELHLISSEDGNGIDFSSFEGVERAVQQGLRAGMKQQSLLTGQLYVEFDMVPETRGFVYDGKLQPPYPVIPTIGTEIDELIAGIADGLKKFNSLDIEGAMTDLRNVITSAGHQLGKLEVEKINEDVLAITASLRRLTEDGRLANAIANLDESLQQIDELAGKMNAGVDPLLEDLKSLVVQTEAGLKNIRDAAREISGLSNPRAPVLLRLQSVLQETERATRALKELSVDLKRNPRSIISGKATPE